MLRVALSQLTTHGGRFIAVGLAVMLSVAFLSTTLMVGASTQASLGASVGEAYSKADLIATPGKEPLGQAAFAAVGSTQGVSDTYAQQSAVAGFTVRGEQIYGKVRNLAPDSMEPSTLVSGRYPATASEVAVDADTAKRHALAAGDKLTLATGDGGTTVAMTVSGLLRASNDPFAAAFPQLLAQTPAVSALVSGAAGATGPDSPGLDSIQVSLGGGVDTGRVKAALAGALTAAGATDAVVRTATEQVTHQVAQMGTGQDALTMILLAFAAVALVVSALVVSNTFSVLVAQRTRELALLRCLGAGRSQIRASVLAEALIVGVVSSLLGVLAGTGLMTALIGWARTQPGMTFATVAVPPSAIVAGLVVGTLLTVMAAIVPARAATAVAPLAAMRPVDDATVSNSRGRVRLVLGLLALALGTAVLVLGAMANQLPSAFAGGALSFVGVLLCATLFVPRLVALAGKLAAPAGVPGRLAAVNAIRNPARTSTTAAALLIGVTLVALMMTGAATSRLAFDQVLAQNYPVDMAVSAASGASAGTPAGEADGSANGTAGTSQLTVAQRDAVRELDGVAAAALLPAAGTVRLDGQEATVYSLTAGEAASVLRDKTLQLEAGKIYLPEDSPETPATVTSATGSSELAAVVLKTRNMPPLISGSSIDSSPQVALNQGVQQGAALWIKLENELAGNQVRDIQKAVAGALDVPEASVSGAAIERVTFNEIIDVLLLVVTGLLGVAVVIALIGVANTLSLSVLERTRENSLLRALGLTRGQLRGMLAIEAVLVAGVAAVIGSVLGITYGWLGAKSALGSLADVAPAVPWLQLLGVVGVAVAAGLLASVMLARRAARLSPVEGLATA